MEIRNLQSFIKVASLSSFSKAAEELGYNQSTITVQIKNLEEELGIKLFDRIGKKVYLTEKGELFYSHSLHILRNINTAVDSIKKETVMSGTLRIGCIESIENSIMTRLLIEYHQQFPQVKLLIKTATSTQLLQMLKNDELDIICTLDHVIYGHEWVKEIKGQEEIVFIGTTEKSYPRYRLQEIVKEPFLLTEKGESYRYSLENILAQSDLQINPVFESGNTEAIIKLVKEGMGIAFLPMYAVEEYRSSQTIKIIDTKIDKITMWLQLIYHKDKTLTNPIKKFIELFALWYEGRIVREP